MEAAILLDKEAAEPFGGQAPDLAFGIKTIAGLIQECVIEIGAKDLEGDLGACLGGKLQERHRH